MRVRIVDVEGTRACKTLHDNVVKRGADVNLLRGKRVVKGRDHCVYMALKTAFWFAGVGPASWEDMPPVRHFLCAAPKASNMVEGKLQ